MDAFLDDKTFALLVISTLIGVLGHKIVITTNWITITKQAGLVLLILSTTALILLLTVQTIRFLIRRRKEQHRAFKKQIEDSAHIELPTQNFIFQAQRELHSLTKNHLAKHYEPQLEQAKNMLKKQEEQLKKEAQRLVREAQEQEKQARERIKQEALQEKREAEEREQIRQLLKYFDKQQTSKTIPEWTLHIPEEVVAKAKKQHDAKQQERARQEHIRKELIRFIQTHKAYPTNYHSLQSFEQEICRTTMKQAQAGILQHVLPEDETLVQQPVIKAKSLTVNQRERLTKQYGYKHYPFITLQGKRGNNLLIKNTSNETDYHFSLKHLLARLHPSAEIEYSVNTQRTDIAYILKDKKIAVEIETGKNNDKQLIKKVAWLNKHFNTWIIICPRKHQKRYQQYIDNKKSYCLTIKHAHTLLQTLLK